MWIVAWSLRLFVNLNFTFLQALLPSWGAAGLATGLAWTLDLSFGSAIVSAPRTSAVATAIVILLIVLLLVLSLSAGRIENLSPQGLKISAFRAFGRIELSKVIAERGRSARFFNLYWRAARKHVAVIFLFAVIFSIFGIVTT